MYLKSIEVQGFKSFANKIVFKFTNGITGIVGPNGSGKSNVADAVRWVLGEQRIKQLRGASMQDVIFSGTQMRKPVGSAYVAITLDNSDHSLAIDYDEVTVARRIYRSGESEYLLNGTICRLKDVNELFYDTGIGKEGYSIIGQGQIDKILSGKPEEKRESLKTIFNEGKKKWEKGSKKGEFTKTLRECDNNLPILMVSAKQLPIDKNKGFAVGTDDYMTKPVNQDEFLYRIKALLRRAKIANERKIVVGEVILDYDSLTVTKGNEVQELPQKEFMLLYKLLSYPGKIFTRIQLMDEIWGAESETGWETVTVHVGRLRKRFEGWQEFEIESVRGLGYKAVMK